MTYDIKKTFRVQHERVVVDTYLVEAADEDEAWFLWNEDPTRYTIDRTDTMNDIVEVVS